MNLSSSPGRVRPFQNSERGSASLIVFALIVVVGSFAVSNNIALAHLQKELRLVEQRQLQRSGAVARTNQPPVEREAITAPKNFRSQ